MGAMDDRRYYGLDALRGGMMALGILLHGVAFYIVQPPPLMPVPTDRNTTYVADFVFHFIHSFRMPAFFLLAGFFASLLVEKRGTWGMFRDRAARVLAPLVAAAVVVLPLTGLFALDFMLAVRFGTMEILPDPAKLEILGRELRAAGIRVDRDHVGVGHLWFLLYLCYFYFLVPVCQALVRHRPRLEAFLASRWAFVVVSLCTALTLLPFRGAQLAEGFFLLKPHGPSLAYYGTFFVFGYILHHHRGVLPALARSAPRFALASVALFPLSLHLSDLDNAAGTAFEYHVAAALAHGFCTWALICTFTGGALRWFDRGTPWVLYLSQSAYWVYLVHMPFICFIAWLLVPYDVPGVIKSLGVIAFATVICFATYHYFVQRTWVGRFLHGKRFDRDWPWRSRQEPAKAAVRA